MDSAQNPVNVEVTAHDRSHVKVVGQIITENLYINGELADPLLDKLDRSGQERGAGFVQGGDAPLALHQYQPRQEPTTILRDWLQNPQVILIGVEGIGGTGKSTLAAWFYGATEPELPQRRYWADCTQGATFAEMARTLLRQFGAAVPEQEQFLPGAVVQCLRQTPALVIVDNLESLLKADGTWQSGDYEQFFAAWQQSGQSSTVWVTTRERPPWKGYQGLQWLSLGGFTPAEGVAFLQALEIQGDLRPFVEQTGGHPLLLRLVATLIREEYPQDPHLHYLPELGLGNLQTLLTDPQVTGPHRRETVGLALVLQASFERLDPADRAVLTSLCVLGSSFETATALAILETPAPNLDKTLRRLHQKSWLERSQTPGQPQYSFQPVVREYLRHIAPDLVAAHHRALQHYRATLTPPPWQTLDDLEAHRNLFYHQYQLADYDTAFDTVRSFDEFLTLQGYSSLRVNLYGQLVEAYDRQNDHTNVRYRASLTDLGNAYDSLGEYGKAIDFHQQHLDIARAIGDRRGEANAWFNLGLALSKVNRSEDALDAFRNARELYAGMGLQSDLQDCENKIQELTQSLASSQKRSKPNFFQWIGRSFRQ